jgi:hypothetical protein
LAINERFYNEVIEGKKRNVPFHKDERRLFGHDIVNDTLNTFLVLLQDLGADRALDRGFDLGVSCNVLLDVKPIISNGRSGCS